MNTPCHHHINGQAIHQALGGFKLTIFNPAAAFQDTMIDFNPPSAGVPLQNLECIIKILNRHSGDQKPFQCLDTLRCIHFTGVHNIHRYVRHIRLALGRLECHTSEANLQIGRTLGSIWSGRHVNPDHTCQGFIVHSLPEIYNLIITLLIFLEAAAIT